MEAHWPVLLIDPDRDAADYVRYALVDGGLDARRVQWTASLGGARVHLRRGSPRVIVTALPLRDADDGQVLDVLRQEAPDVPIVGIAPGPPPVDTGSQSGGAHAYLSRADVQSSLIDQVRAAIQRCRFERQLRADRAADVEERREAMVGRIADTASVEVKDALKVVSEALTQIEARLQAHPAHADALRAARSGLSRAGRAVDGLLSASGQRAPSPSPVSLHLLLRSELPRLKRAAGPGVQVSLQLPPELPALQADPSVLSLVVAILARQAGASMEDGGALRLSARHLPSEHRIELMMADDGTPLHPERASSLPELARSRSLVEQMGGSLDLSARGPSGGQVRIQLPVAADRSTSPKRLPVTEDSPPAPVVMVVEDELLLQSLLLRALSEHGYQTVAASDEDEAREVADRMGHIDVVISDIVLPKGDLANMLHDLRRRWPKVAVVAMSGAVHEAKGLLADAGIDAPVLAKPFRLAQLFSTVRLALDEKSSA